MALLTAGDQGVELIRPDGNIVTMTADEVYYQLRAIKSMIDDNCKSRPVIFQVGDLYHAGALSVGGPGLNAPQARVCQDTAVYNNKLLKKALAPWPKDKTVFTEEEIACFTFLALTRTVQTQATAFEVREETRAAIEELRAQLQAARAQLNARAQQPHATSIANERRPKPAGHKLLVVEGWIPILEDQGPEVLKAAVLAAVAPGGFRDHARHSWEAVAGIVDACAAVAVMGGIPLDLLEAAQRALDDFVIAAGTFTVAQYLQVRRQWAAKAEGPAGLVAAFRHYGTGNVICHNCGESGHFAISCRLPCRVSAQTALCNSLPSQSGLLGTQVGGPRATLTPELIEGAAFSQKNEEAPVDIPLAVSMNRRMATMGGSVYGAQAPIASGSTSSHAGENRDWPREVWPHAPNPNRNVSRSRVWPTDQRLSSHAGANRGRYEASNDSRSDGHAGENRGEFQRSEMNPTVRDGLRKRRVRHRQRTAIRKARFSPGATMNQRVHSDSSVLGIGDSNTEDVDRRAVSTRQFTDDSAQRDGGNAVLAKPLQEEFLRSGESHLPLRPHLELGANPTLGPSPDAQVADGSDLESVDDRSHGAESMKATTPPVASGDGVPRRAHRNRFAVVGRAQSDASDPSVRPEGSECGCLRTHEGQRIGDAAGSLGLPEQPPQAAMVAAEESSELRRVQHQLGGQDAEAVSGSEKQPALVNRDLQGSVVTHNPPDVPHVSVAYGGEGPEGSGSHPVNHREARTVNATFSIQDDHLRGSNGPNRKRAIIDEFVIPAWPRSATRGRDKYWNLPPHVKKVDVLHISALRALALQDEGHAEALERALRWITNSDAYSALTIKTETPRDADVPFTDVRRLLEDGIVELTTKEDALQWGRVFSVPETHKNRRRIIYWPKTVNEAIQTAQAAANEKAFPFTLGLPEEHLAEVFDGDVAASIDLVCAFYQNELVPDVRRYFAFRARDEEGHVAWYRFKRLPMGLVPACEVQQAVTQVLAKTTADVASRVYIDGIRHVGTREEVERALSETKAKCDAVHAQFTEVPISTTHKWLGVMYDFEAKKVRLSDSFIEKLALAFANLESATVADTAQLYGHLFYGSRVLQVPLAQFYHGVKFYAKCSRRWQRDESAGSQPANIWPSIIPLLREWIATLLENEPVTPLKRSEPSDEVIIFADASADGWGSVTFCDGEVICSKGTFEKAKGLHINVKEVLAVSNALRESSLDMSGRRVRIVIDNVSAKAAIRDGYARSFNINVAVKEVQKSMVQRGITDFRISYIKSALNPADKPSRGEMYDNSQLLNALSSLQQLPSEWGMGLRTFYRAMAVCRGQGRLPVPPTDRGRPTTVDPLTRFVRTSRGHHPASGE